MMFGFHFAVGEHVAEASSIAPGCPISDFSGRAANEQQILRRERLLLPDRDRVTVTL
jgi:hypothetical protein